MRSQIRVLDFAPFAYSRVLFITAATVFGIISGACLFTSAASILSKLTERRPRNHGADVGVCVSCSTEITKDESYMECGQCRGRVCSRASCSVWLSAIALWECSSCHRPSIGEHTLIPPARARSELHSPCHCPRNASFLCLDDVDSREDPAWAPEDDSAVKTNTQKMRVRQYVEEIVVSLLGPSCSLNNVAVDPMSGSRDYNHHKCPNGQLNGNNSSNNNKNNNSNSNGNNTSSGDTIPVDLTSISQSHLRQLIQTIVAETTESALERSTGMSSNASGTKSSVVNVAANGNWTKPRTTDTYFQPHSYQELLVTAVLNRIVNTQCNVRHDASESSRELLPLDDNRNFKNSSSISSGSSADPQSDSSLTDSDNKRNISKAEPQAPHLLRSSFASDAMDNGRVDANRVSELGDYIAAHTVPFPNLTGLPMESDEDDYLSMASSQMTEEKWENNWLFRRRRNSLKSSISTGSVGMLVPDPNEDVRAQIGDRVADEISDLSEMGSETDESSLELLRISLDPSNDCCLNQHAIGVQSPKVLLEELIDVNSNDSSHTEAGANTELTRVNVTDTTLLPPPASFDDAAHTVAYVEGTTGHNADQLNCLKYHAAGGCIAATIETPDYQRICLLDSFMKYNENACARANSLPTHNQCATNLPPFAATISATTTKVVVTGSESRTIGAHTPATYSGDLVSVCDDFVTQKRFVPGSIAEREYKKWYNAVEMPNNPYAPEALKQRISGGQEKFVDLPNISSMSQERDQKKVFVVKNAAKDEVDESEHFQERDYKRYSRDYYINDAKTHVNTTKGDTPTNNNHYNSHNVNSITNNTKNSDNQMPEIAINEAASRHSASHEHIYQAMPVHAVDDTISLQSFHSIATTPSDESDTIKTYDLRLQTMTVIREAAVTVTPTTRTMTVTPNGIAAKAETETDVKQADDSSTCTTASPLTTARGSTPVAFKFLQPKRKLINPSQVLSVGEDDLPAPTVMGRRLIEDDVAKALPSVKALAKGFLMASRQCSLDGKHWPTRQKCRIITPEPPATTINGITTDEETTCSDLSSLEIDQCTLVIASPTTTTGRSSPVPLRAGFLKTNIAFFENLKLK